MSYRNNRVKNNRKHITCLFLVLIVITFTLSCSKTTPQNHHNVESALAFESKQSITARLFGQWSVPEVIASTTTITNSSNFYDAKISSTLDDDSQQVIAWSIHEDPAINNALQNYQTEQFTKNISGTWTGKSSTGQDQLPSFSTDQKTGVTVAAWIENESIYSNRYIPNIGWDVAILHGTGEDLRLSKMSNDSLLLLWNSRELNNTHKITASYFDPINGWSQQFGLNTSSSIEYSSYGGFIKHVMATPIQLSDGSFLISWSQMTPGSKEALKSARFNVKLGWSTPLTITSYDDYFNHIELVFDRNNDVAKLIYLDTLPEKPLGIVISNFHLNQGFNETWEPAISLPNQTMIEDKIHHSEFQLVSMENGSNNISIVWLGSIEDTINRYSAIQVSHFDGIDSWSTPELISTPLFVFPLSTPKMHPLPSMSHLKVSSNSQGEIYVAWSEFKNNVSQLKTTHMDTNQNWGTTEVIDTINKVDNYPNVPITLTLYDDVSITSNSNNEANISWIRFINTFESEIPDTLTLYTSTKAVSPIANPTIPFDTTQEKIANHIDSTQNCLACHVSNTVVKVNHIEVIGTCSDCHDGVIALGKSLAHFSSTDQCDACHAEQMWEPAITVDHDQVIGSCSSCHLGGPIFPVNPVAHIQSTEACGACHSTITWLPAIAVDHTQVIGSCINCHDNVITAGMPAYHIPTTTLCVTCHNTTKFKAVPSANVDHDQVIGSCSICHVGVTFPTMPFDHIQSTKVCEACHSTISWAPAITVDHTQLLGSCITCHNNILEAGKAPSHVLSSNQCEECHLSTAWLPAPLLSPINTVPTGSTEGIKYNVTKIP